MLFSKGIHAKQLTQEFQKAFSQELLNGSYPVVELKMYKHLIAEIVDIGSGVEMNIDCNTDLKHRFKCTSHPFLVNYNLTEYYQRQN